MMKKYIKSTNKWDMSNNEKYQNYIIFLYVIYLEYENHNLIILLVQILCLCLDVNTS